MSNDEDNILLEIDNFKPGPVTIGLLTKLSENENIYESSWKNNKKFKNNRTRFAVIDAQEILKDWADDEIKNTWLKVESLCAKYRKEKGIVVHGNSQYIPYFIHNWHGNFIHLSYAKDSECFDIMGLSGVSNAKALIDDVGYKQYMAVMILYEDYFGLIEDALGTHTRLKEWEINQSLPDKERGEKLVASGKQGHEAVYGTQIEKEERWEKYQIYVNKLHKKNPGLSYSDIKRITATHFKVSQKTIQRNCNNPKKNKKS